MTESSDEIPERSILIERQALLDERNEAFRDLSERWNRIGNIRLGAFLAAAGLAIWWVLGDAGPAGVLAVPAALIFLALVFWHRTVGKRRRVAELLVNRVQEDVWRQERDWERLPLRHEISPGAEHPYASDLDLFGRGSLMHLLDTTVTPVGRATLASWLLAHAEVDAIDERQAAVAELAQLVELRDRIAVETELAGAGKADPDAFIKWAEEGPWLVDRALLRWSGVVLPALLFGSLAAQLIGSVSLPLWLLPLAANLLISQLVAGQTAPRIERAGSQRESLRGYAALLRILEQHEFRAPLLQRLRNEARVAGKSPGESLAWLGRIARWWMPRGSFAYLPAQAFLAWDLNYLAWLERWQQAVGPSLRNWLSTAGELEALTAFAALSADHPSWCFPRVDASEERFDARALGHPLLRDDQRVDNDVTIGPAGSFLLVTGSNMSGKSTLLRAVGVNIVLAQAGAPVCALDLKIPSVSIWTSVRVQDSLREGVSFFMAELLRLKAIVDAANARQPGAPPVFYILDEMLQGTNTAERQIAARRIIRHLVEGGNLGAVSTHDLTLADGPELDGLAVAVHLTETVRETDDGPAMVFDYRLRPGIARSTNALKLMDVVGFDFGDGHDPLRIERDLHLMQSDRV